MILEHYNGLYSENQTTKPPLLFLVGEQRRDIIPRTLMDETLPSRDRIHVDELVVYETGVMDSFETDFARAVERGRQFVNGDDDSEKVMWTVVFSPTGCDAMLRVLDLGPGLSTPSDNGSKEEGAGRREFITTIGPTTRDHLRSKYGFDPHVCAEKPSPEGVGGGIEAFMERLKSGK